MTNKFPRRTNNVFTVCCEDNIPDITARSRFALQALNSCALGVATVVVSGRITKAGALLRQGAWSFKPQLAADALLAVHRIGLLLQRVDSGAPIDRSLIACCKVDAASPVVQNIWGARLDTVREAILKHDDSATATLQAHNAEITKWVRLSSQLPRPVRV